MTKDLLCPKCQGRVRHDALGHICPQCQWSGLLCRCGRDLSKEQGAFRDPREPLCMQCYPGSELEKMHQRHEEARQRKKRGEDRVLGGLNELADHLEGKPKRGRPKSTLPKRCWDCDKVHRHSEDGAVFCSPRAARITEESKPPRGCQYGSVRKYGKDIPRCRATHSDKSKRRGGGD